MEKETYKMSPSHFHMGNAFISLGIPNDVYMILKDSHTFFSDEDIERYDGRFKAWETKGKWEYVGYCDALDITVRPKKDSYAVMFFHPDDGECWFHIYKSMIEVEK